MGLDLAGEGQARASFSTEFAVKAATSPGKGAGSSGWSCGARFGSSRSTGSGTGLTARVQGVDRTRWPRHRVVARRDSEEWSAIQCKCYEDLHTLGKGEIDKFLGGSQQPVFRLR